MADVLVAVDAHQAALLVDVRGQVAVFDAVGAGSVAGGRVGGAVFPVVVVFGTAVVVAAHVVAVVAAEAAAVRGSGKGVGLEFAVGEGEVAGRAARAVGDRAVVVARGVHVAAQAAPAEQVVGQGLG